MKPVANLSQFFVDGQLYLPLEGSGEIDEPHIYQCDGEFSVDVGIGLEMIDTSGIDDLSRHLGTEVSARPDSSIVITPMTMLARSITFGVNELCVLHRIRPR